jgi:hypothetical protein
MQAIAASSDELQRREDASREHLPNVALAQRNGVHLIHLASHTETRVEYDLIRRISRAKRTSALLRAVAPRAAVDDALAVGVHRIAIADSSPR